MRRFSTGNASLTNPFASEGERLLAWVRTHPEHSTRDLFEELQRLFPGRYHACQYPALQRAVHLPAGMLGGASLADQGDPWSPARHPRVDTLRTRSQLTHCCISFFLCFRCLVAGTGVDTRCHRSPPAEEEATPFMGTATGTGEYPAPRISQAQSHASHTLLPSACVQGIHLVASSVLSIEQVIEAFLQEVRTDGRSRNTLEWHQTALQSLLQSLTQQQRSLVQELTTAAIRNWLAFLRVTLTAAGTGLAASTITSYARSARAFCYWLVERRYLERTPFRKGTVPKAGPCTFQIVELEEFERVVQACGGVDGL